MPRSPGLGKGTHDIRQISGSEFLESTTFRVGRGVPFNHMLGQKKGENMFVK